MDAGLAADGSVVPDLDVTRELREIAHRHAVAEHAVVRDVDVGEQQAVVADRRHLVVSGRPLNAHVLAQDRAVADRVKARSPAYLRSCDAAPIVANG